MNCAPLTTINFVYLCYSDILHAPNSSGFDSNVFNAIDLNEEMIIENDESKVDFDKTVHVANFA